MSSVDRTPDTVTGWVARMPRPARPYLRLMRADRPAGFWLLMWPCWWSVALAAPLDGWREIKLLALFLAGSIVMRGAGCTWNDILDRRLDAKVARTAGRPIPAGQVSVWQAAAFMAGLALIGLAVLLAFNAFTVRLGLLSLVLVAFYPLAKRVTDWPQAVLGLTFNWGALMGWAAVHGELSAAPVVLYLGCLFWTLGYDTVYAHQDRADDAVVGVRSAALRLGRRTRPALAAFYTVFVLCLAGAGALAQLSPLYYAGVVLAAVHLGRQVARVDIDDPRSCLAVFRSNTLFGWIVFAAAALGHVAPF